MRDILSFRTPITKSGNKRRTRKGTATWSGGTFIVLPVENDSSMHRTTTFVENAIPFETSYRGMSALALVPVFFDVDFNRSVTLQYTRVTIR